MQTEMSTDEISFEKFYEKNFDNLCNYFRSRIPMGECAEDMAQEASRMLMTGGFRDRCFGTDAFVGKPG